MYLKPNGKLILPFQHKTTQTQFCYFLPLKFLRQNDK